MADIEKTNAKSITIKNIASQISGILSTLGIDQKAVAKILSETTPTSTKNTSTINSVLENFSNLLVAANVNKYTIAQALQQSATEAIDALAPKNKYGSWFKENQTAIEKILEARRAKPNFYIAAIWGAEQNPRAKGLANYATNWYATHASVSTGTARRTLKTAQWIHSAEGIEGNRKEKLREKRQRQILVEQMTLSSINSIIGRLTNFEIKSAQTTLLQNTIEKVGTQARFKELHPALSAEENKIRTKLGLDRPTVQDKAFLHANYDGSAHLTITLSRLSHAKMCAAMGSITKNSFTQWIIQRLTGVTPAHRGVKLAVIINAKDYSRFTNSEHFMCQSNMGIRVNAKDVRKEINETIPVMIEGQRTIIPGMVENPNARFASATQREALSYRNCYCAYPDCRRPAHLGQAHHKTAYKDGGQTTTNNLIMLCHKHHAQNDDSREDNKSGHFDIDDYGLPYWQPHSINAAPQYNQHIIYHYAKTKLPRRLPPP